MPAEDPALSLAFDYLRLTPQRVDERAQEQFVRMPDGVCLATDVHLPEQTVTPDPTILTRLPYDKSGDSTFLNEVAAYMMRRGYRVVVQDVRGKFRSHRVEFAMRALASPGSGSNGGATRRTGSRTQATLTAHPAARRIPCETARRRPRSRTGCSRFPEAFGACTG